MNITNTDRTKGLLVPPPLDEFIYDELAELCRITGSPIIRLTPGQQDFSVPDFEYDEIERLFWDSLQS